MSEDKIIKIWKVGNGATTEHLVAGSASEASVRFDKRRVAKIKSRERNPENFDYKATDVTFVCDAIE